MAYNFSTISEKDLSKGMDLRSTEDSLPPGYAEVLQNVDTNSNGHLSKRKGYEGYFGKIPIRVTSITHTGTSITFALDSVINLVDVQSSPIVVYGKLSSAQSGDWTNTNTAVYYETFNNNMPVTWFSVNTTFAFGNNTAATPQVLVGQLLSTDVIDNDNQQILADVKIADTSPFGITYEYSIVSDINVFPLVSEKPTVAGESFSGPTSPAAHSGGGGTETFTITQATHGMSGSIYYLQVYEDIGTEHEQVIPDKLSVNKTSGDISINYISNNPNNLYVVGTKIDLADIHIFSMTAGTTQTFVINNVTDPFNFVSVWKDDAAVSTYDQIIPDNIVYDDAANTLSITLTDTGSTDFSLIIGLDKVDVQSTTLTVTDTTATSTNYTDTNPQLTIWGICHSNIYDTSVAQEGHVTHVDTYRREAEERVIAGLGGNLFASRTRAEVGAEYLIPSSGASVTANVGAATDLYPKFARNINIPDASTAFSGNTVTITNHGFLTDDEVAFETVSGTLPVELTEDTIYYVTRVDDNTIRLRTTLTGTTFISFSAGTGSHNIRPRNNIARTGGVYYSDTVDRENRITIKRIETNKFYIDSGTNTAGTFSTGTINHKLIITDSYYPENNGEFEITATGTDANGDFFQSSEATNKIRDELNACAKAAIYSADMTVSVADTPIRIGAEVQFAGQSNNDTLVVQDFTSVTALRIGGVRSYSKILASQQITSTLTTSIFNLTNSDNFVVGDMCTATNVGHKLRVKHLNSANDTSVTATVDSTYVTFTYGAPHNLQPGQKILTGGATSSADKLAQREFTIFDVPSSTTIRILKPTDATSGTITIIGDTIELDDSITVNDEMTLAVEGRWIPVEQPSTSDNLSIPNVVRHFDANDYTAQPPLRSAMAGDNMYFTNRDDEVFKFDGTSIYQAGLFRWQPQMFARATSSGSIVGSSDFIDLFNGGSRTDIDASGTTITIGDNDAEGSRADDVSQFSVGDRVFLSADGYQTVTSVRVLPAIGATTVRTGVITVSEGGLVDGDYNSSGALIRKVFQYKYYFRLNAIDANQNIIASAATGSEDFIVEIGTTSADIEINLSGPPAFNSIDYDALELEIYRTQANGSTFNLVQTLDVDFSENSGYITFVDTTPDAVLSLNNIDSVNTALLGAELGTGWTQPPRAKFISSLNNRLVAGNIKDYPEIDLVLKASGEGTVDNSKIISSKFTIDSRTYRFTDTAEQNATYPKYLKANSASSNFDDTNNEITINQLNDLSGSFLPTGTVTDHGFQTGDIIRFDGIVGSSLPAELSEGVDYYVIRVSGTVVKLATTKANAVAGTAIDFSAGASGQWAIDSASTFLVDGTTSIAAGNWIYLFDNTATDSDPVDSLRLNGWYQCQLAYTGGLGVFRRNEDSVFGLTSDVYSVLKRMAILATPTEIPVYIDTDDQNYDTMPDLSKENEYAWMFKLATAINAVARTNDPDLDSTASTIVANAGSSFGVGRIVFRQENAGASSFTITGEIENPTLFSVFVNGVRVSTLTTDNKISINATSQTKVFPSRVAVSYTNFPEIFDNPYVSDSDSIIDVNPSDGQEITGIIPFFGTSSFSGSNIEDLLVVFKTNSIYVVKLGEPNLGTPHQVSRLQTRGVGCTAPYSIAQSHNGIMFANNSGIYRLNRDQSISYVGKYIERKWQDEVNLDKLSIMAGHSYPFQQEYQLSVPNGSGQLTNNQVLKYDYERETLNEGEGAWSFNTNFSATGWCNLNNDAFFGTTDGQVFKIRQLGDSTDYRDDAEAVDDMVVVLGARDFGQPGSRKIVRKVTSHFQLRKTSNTGTIIASSTDLSGVFANTTGFILNKDSTIKIDTVSSSIPAQRLIYLQLKYTNSTKDEDVVLTGVDYKVTRLSDAGISDASDRN